MVCRRRRPAAPTAEGAQLICTAGGWRVRCDTAGGAGGQAVPKMCCVWQSVRAKGCARVSRSACPAPAPVPPAQYGCLTPPPPPPPPRPAAAPCARMQETGRAARSPPPATHISVAAQGTPPTTVWSASSWPCTAPTPLQARPACGDGAPLATVPGPACARGLYSLPLVHPCFPLICLLVCPARECTVLRPSRRPQHRAPLPTCNPRYLLSPTLQVLTPGWINVRMSLVLACPVFSHIYLPVCPAYSFPARTSCPSAACARSHPHCLLTCTMPYSTTLSLGAM